MIALDRFDLKILHDMQRDARLTLGQLAEGVSLSVSQCSRRLARLEREGVIQGYSLRLSAEALGLGVTAFIFLSMDKRLMGDPQGVVASLLERNEVIECHTVTGQHDFILKVCVESLSALSAFLANVVSPMEGLHDIATQVAMDTLKTNGPLSTQQE
ncbi:Lrp/AsnC family transcriptional regulator [Halomonas halmophila]|uniref:AsnC family transcriptional regulator n=1 Tax=Halomonas halmophila TaxID=252 RepID=A0A4Y4EWZ4_9GAMM|nr:Lrp/AsnC family transcriptional regulator [Halomonas halmophila]GED22349.1 AsnC family transcriptional regulator [Halomonas halmophila]